MMTEMEPLSMTTENAVFGQGLEINLNLSRLSIGFCERGFSTMDKTKIVMNEFFFEEVQTYFGILDIPISCHFFKIAQERILDTCDDCRHVLTF